MPDSQPDRTRAQALIWAWFVGLALIWGSSFLFIKIGLDEGLPPTLKWYWDHEDMAPAA